MSTTLTPLDFVLLGLYLAGTLGVGLWIGRSIRTGEDFFLGGRKLGVGLLLRTRPPGGPSFLFRGDLEPNLKHTAECPHGSLSTHCRILLLLAPSRALAAPSRGGST